MHKEGENVCNVISISHHEAQQIILECGRSIGLKRKWGGLFIFEIPSAKKRDKAMFGAIDDSDGQCHIGEFKKREQAIDWLKNPKGPKTCRI